MSDSPFAWLVNGLVRALQDVLAHPFIPFEAWHRAIGSLLPFDPLWAYVVSFLLGSIVGVATYFSFFAELWFLINVMDRNGSFPRNVSWLAVFSVISPLLFALAITAAFATYVQTVGDLLAAWMVVASWVVPISLLSESLLIGWLIQERRRTYPVRT